MVNVEAVRQSVQRHPGGPNNLTVLAGHARRGTAAVTAEPAEIVAELKRLRKGRGLQTPAIENVIGPALRMVCGIRPDDGPATVRERTIERLTSLATLLPPDLSLVVTVALALRPDGAGQFLHERIQWLAKRQDRDIRTIRRRVDEGLTRLAEAATRPAGKPVVNNETGWYVQDFETVLRLDLATPTSFERRTIVSTNDGLDRITILYTVPRLPSAPAVRHDMRMDIHYGARILSQERVSDSLFRFELQLPTALPQGARHEYCMIVRLPAEQPMRPHYLYVPERACARFQLRVRFPVSQTPTHVERVSGAFHRAIDEAGERPELIAVDSVGEAQADFADLVPRFAYGLRWSFPRQVR